MTRIQGFQKRTLITRHSNSPDGETMIGVTFLGRVVHIHQSQNSCYSVRFSGKRLGSPKTSATCAHDLHEAARHKGERYQLLNTVVSCHVFFGM